MRKFWKRPVKARDIEVVVTRLDTGEEIMCERASVLYTAERISGKPSMIFAGGASYDVSFRRRTK